MRIRYSAFLFAVVFAVLAAGCMRHLRSHSRDSSTSSSTTQLVELPAGAAITIQCYCREHRVSTAGAIAGKASLTLSASASAGHHGHKGGATSNAEQRMHFFVVPRADGGLLLQSHEYADDNHVFVLDKVDVVVPEGVQVTFDPIDWNALHGRHVE